MNRLLDYKLPGQPERKLLGRQQSITSLPSSRCHSTIGLVPLLTPVQLWRVLGCQVIDGFITLPLHWCVLVSTEIDGRA